MFSSHRNRHQESHRAGLPSMADIQVTWFSFMAGQPTPPPGPRTPPRNLRPYDQGLSTIGFP